MLSVATSSLRRATVAPARSALAQRHLSMACAQSVDKLNGILEDYRSKNYSQEFPRRFQKDVVKAATEKSRHQPWSSSISWLNVPAVSVEGLEHVLENIGASHLMSRSELDGIFREIGTCPISDKTDGDVQEGGQCVISENQMLDLISKNWEEHHAPLM